MAEPLLEAKETIREQRFKLPLPTPAELSAALEQVIREECGMQEAPVSVDQLDEIEWRIGRLWLRWQGHTKQNTLPGGDVGKTE